MAESAVRIEVRFESIIAIPLLVQGSADLSVNIFQIGRYKYM